MSLFFEAEILHILDVVVDERRGSAAAAAATAAATTAVVVHPTKLPKLAVNHSVVEPAFYLLGLLPSDEQMSFFNHLQGRHGRSFVRQDSHTKGANVAMLPLPPMLFISQYRQGSCLACLTPRGGPNLLPACAYQMFIHVG